MNDRGDVVEGRGDTTGGELQVKDAAGLGDQMRPGSLQVAEMNWQRYQYGRDRGHKEYIEQARRCERFYFGCGEQWTKPDRDYLEGLRRPVIELNTIFPAINTALGEQLQTRVDIAYRPRSSEASQETADTLSKLAMHVKDDNDYPSVESQVYGDGIIQRRGYFDIRMDFGENLVGEIAITSLDPLDVIPDPDAQDYDPKAWRDVIVTKFLSADEIEQHYGREARMAVQGGNWADEGFGREDSSGDDESGRNTFGSKYTGTQIWDAMYQEGSVKRYRVIDRQHKVWSLQLHFIDPSTRDMRPVPDGMDPQQAQAFAQANGFAITKINRMRVRWTVTTRFETLHDDWSPYKELTVVGYFPYFRRGKTVGLVDNAISPQELTNKSLSSELHIVNSSANSGWIVEENSLVGMTPDELQEKGSETGVVVVHKQNTKAPAKIQPVQISPTFGKMSQLGTAYINTITGMSQQEQGSSGPDMSGIAVQALQMQAKIQLGPAIDNLARSRRIVARRELELIQQFYTEARIIKIQGKDDFGKAIHSDLEINKPDPTGQILNDMTLGEYGVVITATPVSPTFEQTQFNVALELRKIGVPIGNADMVMLSNLEGKSDIAKKMVEGVDPEVQAAQMAMQKASLERLIAEVEKVKAETNDIHAGVVLKKLQSMYAAMQASDIAVRLPGTAKVADAMLGTSGFVDADEAPYIEIPPTFRQQQQIAGPGAAPIGPENTHPELPPMPASAMSGMGATAGSGQSIGM